MYLSGKNKQQHGKGEICNCWSCGHHGKLLGVLLLVVGLYFIGSDFGWIPVELPIWSLVALVAGLVLLLGKGHRA